MSEIPYYNSDVSKIQAQAQDEANNAHVDVKNDTKTEARVDVNLYYNSDVSKIKAQPNGKANAHVDVNSDTKTDAQVNVKNDKVDMDKSSTPTPTNSPCTPIPAAADEAKYLNECLARRAKQETTKLNIVTVEEIIEAKQGCTVLYDLEEKLSKELVGPIHSESQAGTKERSILINWVLQRANHEGIHASAAFLGIQVMDRLLRAKPFTNLWAHRQEGEFSLVQLYGLTCLVLACKLHYNEGGFEDFQGRSLTLNYIPNPKQVIEIELDILHRLDWNIESRVSWLDWLESYWKACDLTFYCHKAKVEPEIVFLKTVGLLTLAVEHEICLEYRPSLFVRAVLSCVGKHLLNIALTTRPIPMSLTIEIFNLWIKWVTHPGFLAIARSEYLYLKSETRATQVSPPYYPYLSVTVPWPYYCCHGTLWLPTTSSGFDPVSEFDSAASGESGASTSAVSSLNNNVGETK
jgi:hypothetical protein